MYWYVKATLIGIGVLIVGVILFALRDKLPGSGDEPPPKEQAVEGAPDVPTPPGPAGAELTPQLLQKLAIADKHLAADDAVQARRVLDNALKTPGLERHGVGWTQLAERLSEINNRILFTDLPCPEKLDYAVVDGDNLWDIARAFRTTVSMIQKANGMEETKTTIFSGQVLKIYKAEWRIEISKANFILMLMDGERLLKTYPVGVGRQDRTPVGSFRIDEKEREPIWYAKGRAIPFGDPDNVLGTRWLGLEASADRREKMTGYGIHGTWAPDSLGKGVSNGCIRMLNAQVEELFDVVPIGTPVLIGP